MQAIQIINEFTLVSPEMYDKEPEKHPGVGNLGKMLICLAEQMPKVGGRCLAGCRGAGCWEAGLKAQVWELR